MKKMQLGTWLQNKLVLAALLMVLVAGTAVAGVVAMRHREEAEQETEPGYAFQTHEANQPQIPQGNQQGEGPQTLDPTQGWLEQPEGLQGLDSQLQKPDTGKNNKPEITESQGAPEDRPVQSERVEAVSDDHNTLEDPLAGIDPGEAEAETLVSGEDAVVYEPEDSAEEVDAPGVVLEFQADSTMAWPVFGNVVLDYSMDTTIYFPTLEQYKCNPGILIQAEVGQPVTAAARGQVTAIGVDEERGNFIMMDLGSEYTLCYGQLEGILVSVGQIVEAGDVLGVVAQPTKYYVVEGPNMYLEMQYQGEPVDPLDYIR